MIGFRFAHFVKFVLLFLLVYLQSDAAAAHTSMITLGDEIDGMILTKGAAEAVRSGYSVLLK